MTQKDKGYHIRNLDHDTRAMAKAAASLAGVAIGPWIAQAIEEKYTHDVMSKAGGKMAHTKVTVERLPKCDFCAQIARYEGRTKDGRWAKMCEGCFAIRGIGLGLGKGQELILASVEGLEL